MIFETFAKYNTYINYDLEEISYIMRNCNLNLQKKKINVIRQGLNT